MPELARKKVGIIACSGEEMAEGTVTRLAALRVLESLRPRETVTICLPLFLAGGEGDRAFARFHPTISVDGCEKRCAARGTEMYSGKPAVSIVIGDRESGKPTHLGTARHLSEAGKRTVREVADQIARHVDRLLGHKGDRRGGSPPDSSQSQEGSQARQTTCSCGSEIPVTKLRISGREVSLLALPLIFAQFREAGKLPSDSTKGELLEAARIYNAIPGEASAAYAQAILEEYRACCRGGH
jgi:hypothetical protein